MFGLAVIILRASGNYTTISWLVHMLFECNRINHIWIELRRWLGTIMNRQPIIDVVSVILGSKEDETIVNYIILITKHEKYKSKWNQSNISLIKLKRILKHHMNMDIYVGTMRNSVQKHWENGQQSIMYYEHCHNQCTIVSYEYNYTV